MTQQRKPTFHIMKPGLLSEGIRTRCGVLLTECRKGDMLGTEDGLVHINCAGCLRELLVETRIKASRLEDNKYSRWLFGDDTGMSSVTIWSVMNGISPERVDRRAGIPHDPQDFGRCHRLLEHFPAWRSRMHLVSATYAAWAPLIDAGEWESLTALYLEELPTGRAPKLAARLKELAR